MQKTIKIKQINEVFLFIDCDSEQARELYHHVSCMAPNFQFHPKYRSRIWNGRISFFDTKTRLLPIGLLKDLISFAEKYSYECDFLFDVEKLINDVSEEDVVDFYSKLFNDSDFEPRDYQHEAIMSALTHKRGIIVSPTGSGKSLDIYTIIRFILLAQVDKKENDKILLIVPNISLVEQMFSDFKEYGWKDIDEYCGILYAGKEINYEKPVLISTWQSVYKRDSKFFSKFGTLIVDECHQAKATSINQIARECVNAEYRIGFTGTMSTVPADMYNIYGYLGPQIFNICTKTLQDKDVLSQITIANLILKYPDEVVKSMEEASYAHEVRFITDYEPRNKVFDFIIKSKEPGENILILCQRIKHLKNIESYVLKHYPSFKTYCIYQKVKAEEREEIRVGMEKKGDVIIIGTFATMSVGINIKNLHHVVLASSYKSKTKILQSIGRGLRKHASKKQLILWDIIDNFIWVGPKGGQHVNHVYKHFIQRMTYYKEQGFEFFNKIINL